MTNKLDSKDLSKVTGGENDFNDIYRRVSNIENLVNQCLDSISSSYYFYIIKTLLTDCRSDGAKDQCAVLKNNLGLLKFYLNNTIIEYPELKNVIEQYIMPELENLNNIITE